MSVRRRSAKATGERDGSPSYWRLIIRGSSRVAEQRLTATVENFEAGFERRLEDHRELRDTAWARAVRNQLEVVRGHQSLGYIDTAWRCFTPAARLELEVADEAELITRAKELRQEAASGKLASGWRSKTILDLLQEDEIEGRLSGGSKRVRQRLAEATHHRDEDKISRGLEYVRRRLAEATRHRDDDAENRYYKVALVRGQRSLLLLILLACIAILLALAAGVDWDGDLGDPPIGFVALVAVFGAIGACLSAIQSLGRAGAQGRIPEHVASSVITITRPALGAAAAVGVYAIAASGILNIQLEGDEAHLTILALAFAAGFSERLVLSAVGAATGITEGKEKS